MRIRRVSRALSSAASPPDWFRFPTQQVDTKEFAKLTTVVKKELIEDEEPYSKAKKAAEKARTAALGPPRQQRAAVQPPATSAVPTGFRRGELGPNLTDQSATVC